MNSDQDKPLSSDKPKKDAISLVMGRPKSMSEADLRAFAKELVEQLRLKSQSAE